jgi:hypothetical protein
MATNVTRRDKTYVLLMVGVFLAGSGVPLLVNWSHPLAGAVLIMTGLALAGTMRIRRTRAGFWP